MDMAECEKLCALVRSMEYIQIFSLEHKYVIEDDCTRLDLRMTLSPQRCYLGEERLQIIFHGVCDLKLAPSVYSLFFTPVITIADISEWKWENCHYYIEEVEDSFSFACDDFEYCFLPVAEIGE